MGRLFQPLLFLFASSTEHQLRRQIEFLRAENEMLRRRVPKQRIFLSKVEQEPLFKLGKAIGLGVAKLITIVHPRTFQRWIQCRSAGRKCETLGQPRTVESVRDISLRAYMLNVCYDFQLPGTGCKPYIGAGAGIYQAEFNGVYPGYFDAVGAPLEDNPINATSDTLFAWQVLAGVARLIGCRTEFFSGYRYFKGSQMEFASGPFSATGGPIFLQDGAEIHAAEMGFRVRF